MTEEYQGARPPLGGLTAKLIAFVCVCTSATALLVSGIAIQASYSVLQKNLAQQLSSSLEHSAAAVAAWRDARPSDAPLGESDRRALRQSLERERDGAARMMLLDAEGMILVAALEPDTLPPHPGTGAWRMGTPGLRHYQDAQGVRLIGASLELPGGWQLVVEDPFRRAYAPVMALAIRLLLADLAVILLFGLLAYKITTATLRPIATLSEAARRIAQGQFDHEIPESGRSDEVGLLSHAFNDMMRRLREHQGRIETTNEHLLERNSALQQAKETFEQLAITDGLTHLHNHRFFQDHLTREIKRVNRTGEPLAMLLIDIDDFKQLNDRFGHAAGDEFLTGLARIMSESTRDSDLLARYGGEEFVVLASNTELLGAYELAEKIRMAAADTSFILDESNRPVRATVSIGVARYGGNRKTFFVAADRALYRAKAEGKNCVVMDEDDPLA